MAEAKARECRMKPLSLVIITYNRPEDALELAGSRLLVDKAGNLA